MSDKPIKKEPHSEGHYYVSNSAYFHAEGYKTKSIGKYSHAEGDQTLAYGQCSHAEGLNTRALGVSSHTEGKETIASSEYQHVQGRFNIEDANDTYCHIVGNGNNEIQSNAHTLDWQGNAWYQGDIYVGNTSQEDGKKLSTEEYVDTKIAELLATIESLQAEIEELKK